MNCRESHKDTCNAHFTEEEGARWVLLLSMSAIYTYVHVQLAGVHLENCQEGANVDD